MPSSTLILIALSSIDPTDDSHTDGGSKDEEKIVASELPKPNNTKSIIMHPTGIQMVIYVQVLTPNRLLLLGNLLI